MQDKNNNNDIDRLRFDPLAKLVEELGELSQVAGKALQVGGLDKSHWNMFLKEAFVEEAGDVIASIEFLIEKYQIDRNAVQIRTNIKLERFKEWATTLSDSQA